MENKQERRGVAAKSYKGRNRRKNKSQAGSSADIAGGGSSRRQAPAGPALKSEGRGYEKTIISKATGRVNSGGKENSDNARAFVIIANRNYLGDRSRGKRPHPPQGP